jgi:hypothetical protein
MFRPSHNSQYRLEYCCNSSYITPMEVAMQTIRDIRLQFAMVTLLTVGLILTPVFPDIALAAEAAGAAGSSSYEQPAGTAGGAASGVGVSGPSGKPASTGKGALAPPKGTQPPAEKPPVKSAGEKPPKTDEAQNVPKGIAASAGTAGTAAASSGGGISLGWKIAGGVLGVGLLVGLAGGGGSSGGGTTPSH